MDKLFPCKNCGHHYEDHIPGYRCVICWVDSGHDVLLNGMCRDFVGDNLKYLEDKHEEKT